MDKETLQKKIESGDTVWVIEFGFRKVLELKLSSEYKINDYGNLVRLTGDFDGYNSCIRTYKEIYHVFDTKEEAEWQLEFGNITRTEKLELPTWEQALEQSSDVDCGTTFVDARKGKWQLIFAKNEIILCDWSIMGRDKSWKELTYENYLEACRLCKKLFLGEEL